MTSPFDIWAPIIRAPFSGDVTQEIVPRVFSPDIQGVPEIEEKVQTEVASYGKQLGKVLEALETLGKNAGVPLPDIDKLIKGVEAVKSQSAEALKAEAEAALARLRAVDEPAWRGLLRASEASEASGTRPKG
ncbi:hypothetical protein [Pseudodonghicola flavimaris]|uniref:Uncharacterized protein n=1 Tax=Pseudodonghicola flavimaris TaxID=3050036 RepID=A0ABT7F0J9_9RHOB|nr:hypothetical protein [Pseudodonghicola flavimaris]MDK3018129.1 hypothetical protein [Pseudodonghicola flavimaris]